MANLLKYNQVVCEEDMRIINSNAIIAEKIKELADAASYVKGENYDNEFYENLDADKVERLLEEPQETEKAATEASAAIVARAHEEAHDIIERAEKEGEQLRNEAYSKGEQQGYDDGYKKAAEEVEALKQEVLQQKQEQEQSYQKKLSDMEPVLVDTLVDILENAFSIQFAEKREFILHLLQGAFSKIDNSKEYLVRVSKEDYPLVIERRDEIEADLPQKALLEIVEDLTLAKNQCLIETDGGVFDCGLDTQMDNLTRDLRMLSVV